MDLFLDMRDLFEDDIWKELGPVDPNWFEKLTAETPVYVRNVPDQDELCANQEGNFKAPLEKAVVETQLFSTPKVFRQSPILSPETNDDPSVIVQQGKVALPWMETQRPCLFQDSKFKVSEEKCGKLQSQNESSFDLLATPKESPTSYVQYISESLGAQMNPDISWTSSMNTPPPLPSTLILSKPGESPCPRSNPTDNNVIFVRNLFSSITKSAKVREAKSEDMLSASQDPVKCEAEKDSSTSLDHTEDILEDKSSDGGLQSTGVLVKTEHAPSMQIILTDTNGSEDVSSQHGIASGEIQEMVTKPSEILTSPPVQTETAVSQWSPLNLSEIPPCDAEVNVPVENLQSDSLSEQLTRPSIKIYESAFIKKKRTFVYTVGALKPQIQEEPPSENKVSSSNMSESGKNVTVNLKKSPNEANSFSTRRASVKKQLNFPQEKYPRKVQCLSGKVQGLDMSQLCRDFAQDFSQMSDCVDQVKVAKDVFSPSACLSALKQAKQKAKQTDFPQNSDDTSTEKTCLINRDHSMCEQSKNDSGFQSCISNTATMISSSYDFPSSKKPDPCEMVCSFRADVDSITPSSTAKTGDEKVLLESTLTSGDGLNAVQACGLEAKSESNTELASAWQQSTMEMDQTFDNMSCLPTTSLPTSHASGFKTASNKGICITPANLKRAKNLFDEAECLVMIGPPNKSTGKQKSHASKSLDLSKSSDTPEKASNSQLTASQRADVTELCSLLEDDNSQNEFTQFRAAKKGSNSSPKGDKEIDSEFLVGINFDDSFNSDAEHLLLDNATPNKMTPNMKNLRNVEISNTKNRSPEVSSSTFKEENTSPAPGSRNIAIDESKSSKLEKKDAGMLDFANNTAGDKILRVSKKHLTKAKTLFADLEEHPLEKSYKNQISDTARKEKSNTPTNMCKLKDERHVKGDLQDTEEGVCSTKQITSAGFCGFHMASGKQITFSADYMEKASAVFKDCDIMDHDGSTSCKTSTKPFTRNISCQKNVAKFKNISEEQAKTSKSFEKVELIARCPKEPRAQAKISSNCTRAFRSPFPSLQQTTSKNIDPSVADELSAGDGFHTACGEKVSVSAEALKKDELLCGDILTTGNNKETQQKEITGTLIAEQQTAQALPSKDVRFETMCGKEVTILEAEDKIDTPQTCSEVQVTTHAITSGFSSASGKSLMCTSKALQKAKVLFNQVSLNLDTSAASDARTDIKKHQDTKSNTKNISCAFKTAKGTAIHVSKKSLSKTKLLLKEFDNLASTIDIQKKQALVPGCDVYNDDAVLKGDTKAKVCLSDDNGKLNPNQCGSLIFSEEHKNGCTEDSGKGVQKESMISLQGIGFQMASGKAVALSAEGLKKAKALLDECEGVEKNNGAPLKSKSLAQPFRRSGFHSAWKKPSAVSSDVPQKAKAHFDNFGLTTEISDVSLTKTNENSEGDTEKKCCGFTPAEGAKVHVSKESLLKTKHVFKNLDASTSDNTAQELGNGCPKDTKKEKRNESAAPSCTVGFQMASGKVVALSAEALKKAKVLLDECKDADEKSGASLQSKATAPPLRRSVIHSASKKPVAVSSEAIKNGICSTAKVPDVSLPKNNEKSEKSFVFTTPEAAKIYVSKESLLKSKHVFKDFNALTSENTAQQQGNRCPKDTKKEKQTESMMLSHDVGFQMASGKVVNLSAEALKKAKTLLDECEGVEAKTSGASVKSKASTPPQRRSGFHSAVKKPVAVSSEATLKAKPRFADMNLTAKVPSVSLTKNNEKSEGETEKKSFVFTAPKAAKVHVLKESLLKAKHVFQEFDASENTAQQHGNRCPDDEKKEKQKESVLRSHDVGFQMASGKTVNLSVEALKKAKALLDECKDADEKSGASVKSKTTTPPLRRVGFHSAVKKPAAVSSEARLKAKPCFADISSTVKVPDVSLNKNNERSGSENEKRSFSFATPEAATVHGSKKRLLNYKHVFKKFDVLPSGDTAQEHGNRCPDDEKKEKQREGMVLSHDGFQTASGKAVALSAEALKKAKALLDECEGVEEKRSGAPLRSKAIASPLKRSGFHCASKKPLEVSSEAPQMTKAVFDNIDLTTEASGVLFTETNKSCGGDTEEKTQSSGFCTAEGAKVSVSKESLVQTKHVFQDCNSSTSENTAKDAENGCSMDTVEQMKPKDIFPPQCGGFQTASGKAVAVSSEALKKAKSMLEEHEDAEMESFSSSPQVQKTNAGPVPKSGGFSSAGGKPVTFSSESLQKAKALYQDTGLHTDESGDSNVWTEKNHEKPQHDPEKRNFGFTTAGGRKVTVSEENLVNATNLLRESTDRDYYYLDSDLSSPHDLKSDLPKANTGKNTSYTSLHANSEEFPANENFSSESKPFGSPEIDKPMESIVADLWSCQEDEIVPLAAAQLPANPAPVESHVLDADLTKTFEVESSNLNLQSMNLTGCTATQRKFLVQEALDCTKALLEDESFSNHSQSSDIKPSQHNPEDNSGSSEEAKVRKKRPMGDADMSDEPPLKRQLLNELDRPVDDSNVSRFLPVITHPNVFLKDRGVFLYSISVQPNITKPQRHGRSYMEIKIPKTTPKEGSSAQSKTVTFVPPFIKNTKTDAPKAQGLKEKSSTPVFVPPFKKHKSAVQNNTTEERDEQCLQTCQTNKSSPTSSDKLPAPTDDSANSHGTNNSSVCVDGQVDSSDAEASHPHDESSKDQDINQDLQNIELARDMQDMRIRKKKRQTIRPLPGSLFLTKTSGLARIPLKEAVGGKLPTRCTTEQLYKYGVQRHVSEVRSETSEAFRFNLLQFTRQEALLEGGIQLADGGWLIPRNDWTAGKEEFYRALCDTPGVDPKLISEAWVYNHYRWIVWKQACMEKSFPETMGSFCLTPDQVLLQLKYRYDVEVDNSRRPALRKIMEKDDTEAKTIILCVSDVVCSGQSPNKQLCNNGKTLQTADAKPETPVAVVWLTDGWYAIKAQLDKPLSALLDRGLLAVGGKLMITGAQLVGSQEACCPLEAPESLMLKLCINSCRRARWDAKLGFYRDPRPFLLPLCSLYSNGGPVGCVDVVILRSYPIQWMEKKTDGGVVFRSSRAEEKEARRYNNLKHKSMEMLFAKIQAEFEKEEKGKIKPPRSRQVKHQNIKSLQDGEELHEAIGDDSAFHEAHLSEQQMVSLSNYRRTLMEKKQTELQDRYRRAMEAEDSDSICPKRNVAPVWRISVADSLAERTCFYQLNLWRPSPDLQSLLKEGNRYKVYNLVTSDGKKRSGIESIQLTGTKKTQFQDLQASPDWLLARFQPRVSTDFATLQNKEFHPLCGEVDLTGYVISVKEGHGSSPAFYLTDDKLNFVKVRCFSSFTQAGLEDVVKPRVLLALSNLQLRGQSLHPTPVVYAGDLTGFSTNPKEVHLQESINHLKNQVLQCRENFFLNAEEKLSHLVKSAVSLQPQTPVSTTDRRQDSKTNESHQRPNRNLGSFTPANKNTSTGTLSAEKDPRHLKRRRALDYLSRIPSPPHLSHLNSTASPCVNRTFNPPRRSGTPSTLKTAQTTVEKLSDSLVVDEWVNDEELAMIDTQHLHDGDFNVVT